MNLEIILHAGLATGTILLFASIGEILSERAGILNLGLEGMMLLGAMAGFSTAPGTGNPWWGLLAAMLAGGALSLAHGLVTIHFQADQVMSGLSLTFLGTGLALVLGNGLTGQTAALIPNLDIPGLAAIPFVGPTFFADHSPLVYVGYLFTPLVWFYIHRTRPGLHLRAVGEKPSAADTMGIDVDRVRYLYIFVGGVWQGWPGPPSAFQFHWVGIAPRRLQDRAGSPLDWSSSPCGIPGGPRWGAIFLGHCAGPSWTCRDRACRWALPIRSLSTPTSAFSYKWHPTSSQLLP